MIENNDANEPRVEGTKQDGKSKLEETCVLVDGDKLGFVSQSESKNTSYKVVFSLFKILVAPSVSLGDTPDQK